MKINNRRALFDYQVKEKFEAGIVLTGPEVKSAKLGQIKLEGSFVKIIDQEPFLVNAQIFPYKFADNRDYDPKRSRRLLLHKSQIESINSKVAAGNLTLIPLSCYTKGRIIKLEIGLAKGKKKWDKREAIKKRDLDREQEQIRIK